MKVHLKRGRWTLFHDWMSTHGGFYPTRDRYTELSFQMFHWDGLSFSVCVMAPVIGDVHMQVQNKKSIEEKKRTPHYRHAPQELQRFYWTRRTIQEIKDIEKENHKQELRLREWRRKRDEQR